MTRRRWVAGVGGALAAATAVDAFAVEPNRVAVTRHAIGMSHGRTVRLAQLSDLHLRSIDAHAERVAVAVRDMEPDVIVLTGDAIDDADDVGLLGTFLGLLPPASAKIAILGNWEHWAGVDLRRLEAAYARAGWQLLRNASTTVNFGATRVLVTGLDDLVGGTPDVARALRDAVPAPNHVVLAHCPTHREAYAVRTGAGPLASMPAVDPVLLTPALMLSGHTHGGQVAPFGWAPLRPRGSGRYTRGWYRDGAFPLYVSRGIGTSILHARLCATPEVACFDWTLAAG